MVGQREVGLLGAIDRGSIRGPTTPGSFVEILGQPLAPRLKALGTSGIGRPSNQRAWLLI